jgi:hypothetical protein
MATADGNSNSYSREEVSALKGLFSLYDTDDSGYISVKEVDALLQKIGRSGDDAAKILEGAEKVAQEGRITFEDFLGVLEKGNADVPGEGPDPKVLEFLRILEEYRVKCEDGECEGWGGGRVEKGGMEEGGWAREVARDGPTH